jgi:hypothetical protein
MPPPNGLGLPTKLTRWIVLQKARRHPTSGLRLLVRTQFQVLFHSAIRSSFNLSLTVLVHYRSQDIFSLGGWSLRFQSGFHVSRPTRQSNKKVPNTLRTWLSQSMANLSRLFCSPREFITFYRLVVASVSNKEIWINPELLTG